MMAIRSATLIIPAFAAAAALPMAALPVHAESDFPNRPVRLVNPYSPGGSVDLVGRPLAQGLTELWGQQVIVDNRPGAGTQIGTEVVVRAEPNGYTMLVTSSAVAINPSIYRKMRFDAVKDLYPIVGVAQSSPMLAVHPGLPAKSVQELIALAKSQPGKITVAVSGIGSTNHLTAEMFKSLAAIDLLVIPYKGGGPAIVDLIGGQIKMFFNSAAQLLPHHNAGRMRVLATGAAERVEYAPEFPTIAEQGVPGFEASTWYAVYGPSGLPKSIAQHWNDSINKWLQSPHGVAYFRKNHMKRIGGRLETFATFHKSEIARWGKVVKAAGVEPQ